MYDISRSKRAHRAYSFDDIAIAPSRRTRGGEQVNLSWKIDAVSFDFPILAAPMDSVMSPTTAIEVGELGGLGVLNLEGLWTRYDDPLPLFEELAEITDPLLATRRMQQIYAEAIKPELIAARLAEIRAAGVPVAGALSPQNTQEFASVVESSGLDFFVIRGTAVSAEHVSDEAKPLNLKEFIYEMDAFFFCSWRMVFCDPVGAFRQGRACSEHPLQAQDAWRCLTGESHDWLSNPIPFRVAVRWPDGGLCHDGCLRWHRV